MNNKYAEGYPGRRYYGGCEFVDVTEQLAIDRAKALLSAGPRERAAVTPAPRRTWPCSARSSLPNDPGESVLGMVPAHGGHLTHGCPST